MPYKDQDAQRQYHREYYLSRKTEFFWRFVKNKYGLTQDGFMEILEDQKYSCALCEKPFKEISKTQMHIDHCHETGKIRGLLCMKCNVGLGMLGDNEEGLLKALSYVRGDYP